MSRIAESQAMRLFTQQLFDGEGLCEAHAETWRMAGWVALVGVELAKHPMYLRMKISIVIYIIQWIQ